MTTKSCFGWAMGFALLIGVNITTTAQDQNTATQPSAAATSNMGMPGANLKSGVSTGKDLAISAAKSADHTILFRALRVSGLTEQASSKGPFTVFAPTNEAFNKLPEGTVDGLLQPAAKAKLVKLLAYHVVKGKLTSDQLQDGQKLKTVTGGTLTVGKQGDTVTITDGAGNTATVNAADVETTNGIVHSIDTVLMPAEGGK
ncbi:fasciclin domain-containing protein [Spirosoma endbachense]|uniref:Fasciclin domain-containing protein n=1 Tax=Spirosoma endbachense TaxID=2666025 RepID=A0A6P1VPB3_9BACT|nr:fasciclin domain-containing protein [Spirosoma endbachense]QHV94923.1 fasciclin domain-containing protein [Spirosoma endbachense]